MLRMPRLARPSFLFALWSGALAAALPAFPTGAAETAKGIQPAANSTQTVAAGSMTAQQHPRLGVTRPDSLGRGPQAKFPRQDLKQLMRPSFKFAAEWQAEANDISLTSYDVGLSIPTYPVFGPPPPIVNVGFDYTHLDAPPALGLPTDLYVTDLGLAWMRRINERWMMRFMAGASFATDGKNGSSDAWRFRGGAFALYRRNPRWTWTFGALALGRNDLPVVPAVGVIHQPSPAVRIDLIMPRPRLSFLLVDGGARQQWGYVGMGLNGTTWGVQRVAGVDDQLTYGDFRAVVGWTSTPTPDPGIPFTRGRKLGIELGYVFSRDFEWENDGSIIRLDDTLMLRGSANF